MSKTQEKASAHKREHASLQKMKFINFFVGHSCPPGSGSSNSNYCGSMRIRIHNPGSNFLSERWRVLELSCGFSFPTWKAYISVLAWVLEAKLLIEVSLVYIFIYIYGILSLIYSLWFHIWKDPCLSAETPMGCRDWISEPSTAALQSDAPTT